MVQVRCTVSLHSEKGWRMFSYDGKTFRVTRKMYILFEGMEDEKERWIIQFWWIAHMQR